ncbi:MAG: N-acetylmuramoyl-L-alanine amidase, partial [bacterium]
MIKFNKIWILLFVFIGIGLIPGFMLAQEFALYILPDSVRLHLVFPVDGDSLNFDRIRYAGSALPTAQIKVQGQDTRVYPSGAFVGLVELEPGQNTIIFTAQDSFGILSDTLHVYRKPPMSSCPEIPTSINPEHILPAEDIYLSPGDIMDVEFLGSPGGQATFSIDKIAKNFNMVELSKRAAKGLRGLYKGTVLIPQLQKYKTKPVEFKFRGKDGHKLKFKSKGLIHILSRAIPLIGVTTDSINLVRTSVDGEIWMELPPDIKLQIIGERDGFKKVRFAENVIGYMASNTLKPLPFGSTLPHATVGSIGTLKMGDWIQLRINLSEKVPFKIEQLIDPAALEITFYRASQAPHWITYPQNDDTIRMIQWCQVSSDMFVLRVSLNQKQQWGHYGRYVGRQFWLNIRRSPEFSLQPDSLLQGLIITVDPGHGGEAEGAVSATNLLEKNVNLHYAQLVADLLEAEGATVIRTRTRDTTLSLRERIALAREAHSHIFLSLHNNSIAASTNPLRPRGTSTYYTVPQSQAIAKAVYRRLLDLGLPPFGRVSSTYFVTRQTSLLSFLVEGAFMS